MSISSKEITYSLSDKAPTHCSYCDDAKSFLMVRPPFMSLNGELHVHVNMTKSTRWMCLDCLALEIDAMGHSVDIHEYE